MRKFVMFAFFITLMISGCFFSAKNPVLDNEAFEIIGDQGINDSVTLEDIQGNYTCTLWFVEFEKSQYSEDEFDCIGKIVNNQLIVMWDMEGVSYTFGEDISFKLDEGIIISDDSALPDLICAVKVYPSGHMVDGLGILEIEMISVRIHFQLVK
ncbi:MAG: hypothetical protein KMY54_02455 [Erysipelothrix sp.]|nr:hypothetical protein [Erysipelothrix sp.]